MTELFALSRGNTVEAFASHDGESGVTGEDGHIDSRVEGMESQGGTKIDGSLAIEPLIRDERWWPWTETSSGASCSS